MGSMTFHGDLAQSERSWHPDGNVSTDRVRKSRGRVVLSGKEERRYCVDERERAVLLETVECGVARQE